MKEWSPVLFRGVRKNIYEVRLKFRWGGEVPVGQLTKGFVEEIYSI